MCLLSVYLCHRNSFNFLSQDRWYVYFQNKNMQIIKSQIIVKGYLNVLLPYSLA